MRVRGGQAGRLLANARQAGAVAANIELDEVIALLAATTQAALRSAQATS